VEAAAVVGHDRRFVAVEARDDRVDVGGDLRGRVILHAGRLIALVEAALRHRHDLVVLGERWDLVTPVEPEPADAVHQHEERPFAGGVIVDPHPAGHDVPLLQADNRPAPVRNLFVAARRCRRGQTDEKRHDQHEHRRFSHSHPRSRSHDTGTFSAVEEGIPWAAGNRPGWSPLS
jgi:hypothetical protein